MTLQGEPEVGQSNISQRKSVSVSWQGSAKQMQEFQAVETGKRYIECERFLVIWKTVLLVSNDRVQNIVEL